MISLMYIVLAVLGLSFLIFIHELGHYFMARRVGMRVEIFSIGLGKPIVSWELRDGEKWQIGWLLFGGYVKIGGTDTGDDIDPYLVEDGFFGKSPFDRIKVAFMGPFVNLVFAFLLFGLLWGMGGREKHFAEFTPKIGWVDTNSELYELGVRPGDEVLEYDDSPFHSAKDHLYAPMTSNGDLLVKGLKVNYETGDKVPFEYKVKVYPLPNNLDKGIYTSGITTPASYVLYDLLPGGVPNPIPRGSPMEGSGIEYGDRVIWADGEVIFSLKQLNEVLNDGRALLTIKRGSNIIQRRVPRVQVKELRPDHEFKEEITDWQFEAKLGGAAQDLYMIPYNLTYDGVVESQMPFIDPESEVKAFPEHLFSPLDHRLKVGDRIVAVDGLSVVRSHDVLQKLQQHHVNIIIQRANIKELLSWDDAIAQFDKQIPWKDIQRITASIGTEAPIIKSGEVHLLKSIVPKKRSELAPSTPGADEGYATQLEQQRKAIESIEDPERRAQVLRMFEDQENQLLLGLYGVQDLKVNYNPGPFASFYNVTDEIAKTLSALFSGNLNPKWLSGPIGIVQVVHTQSMVGIKEAVFWMGLISLNLGVLNLLPIPLLDGGTIVFSFLEMVTGRRIKPKTLERLIIPFAVILIGFFVFLTYNDLTRIFGRFLHW